MLDIKYMRENPDKVMAAMATLGAEDAPVREALLRMSAGVRF